MLVLELYCHQRPGGGLWHKLMLETKWRFGVHAIARNSLGSVLFLTEAQTCAYSAITDCRLTMGKQNMKGFCDSPYVRPSCPCQADREPSRTEKDNCDGVMRSSSPQLMVSVGGGGWGSRGLGVGRGVCRWRLVSAHYEFDLA